MTGFDRGHALIIGVGTYDHAPQKNVPITVADAEAIATVLRDQTFCGYPEQQVTLLSNAAATRDGVLNALDALAARVTADDTVLLFYSGHGDYAADGTYYLTTHDTRFAGKHVEHETGVGQATLLDKVRALPAARVLLIFNACHAGNVSPTLGGEESQAIGAALPRQTTAALLSTGSGRVVITACRENQYSFIGNGALTIFAQALYDGLRGQGVSSRQGFISAFDLYTHLYFTITDAVERSIPADLRNRLGGTQEPELTIIKGVGPFAVSLYRGSTALGQVPADEAPAEGMAVRKVDPVYSQEMLRQLQAGRDIIQSGRDTYQQNIGGDQINAPGAQGFLNRPSGPVNQNFGQQGDSFRVGDVSGQGIAIGHGSQAQWSQQTGGGRGQDLAALFAPVHAQIQASTQSPEAVRAVLTEHVRKIEQEAAKGEQADAQQIAGWLAVLRVNPDILNATVNVLLNPAAGVSASTRAAATSARS